MTRALREIERDLPSISQELRRRLDACLEDLGAEPSIRPWHMALLLVAALGVVALVCFFLAMSPRR